jgi:hypothetical protein
LTANFSFYNKIDDLKFDYWLAGVGGGKFDLIKQDSVSKNLSLKAIRIKLRIRDVRNLTRIQEK